MNEGSLPCEGCEHAGHRSNPRAFRSALKVTSAIVLVLFLLSFIPSSSVAQSDDARAERAFTEQELAAFDGKDGRPAYFAYEGKVYDASASPLFKDGEHYGHLLGKDLTGKIEGAAPHGEEVLAATPVVGLFGVQPAPPPTATEGDSAFPILIFGKGLAAWSGYLLWIFFILNFATCFVMPWHFKKMPWHGSVPGQDTLDQRGMLFLSYHHRTFAWLLVIFGLIHGVLATLRSLFGIAV